MGIFYSYCPDCNERLSWFLKAPENYHCEKCKRYVAPKEIEESWHQDYGQHLAWGKCHQVGSEKEVVFTSAPQQLRAMYFSGDKDCAEKIVAWSNNRIKMLQKEHPILKFQQWVLELRVGEYRSIVDLGHWIIDGYGGYYAIDSDELKEGCHLPDNFKNLYSIAFERRKNWEKK